MKKKRDRSPKELTGKAIFFFEEIDVSDFLTHLSRPDIVGTRKTSKRSSLRVNEYLPLRKRSSASSKKLF